MKRSIGLMFALILLASLLLGCDVPGTSVTSSVPALAPTSETRLLQEPTRAPPDVAIAMTDSVVLAALEGSLQSIYANVNPSVVSIRVGSSGAGSGFVWDQNGHIVTNNHVVADGGRLAVMFHDGTTVNATVVGTDRDSDLAVLKVSRPAEELKPVTVADSSLVQVGQLVVAIGNPFGLQNTMTVGFVSATGRGLPVDPETEGVSYSIPDVIQTDASINPGNSGGVLVDSEGRLIGVTSAIVSPVRASAGVGFAVPSAIVKNVVPVLIERGRFEHPWLGLTGTTLTPDLAEAMGLPAGQRGALVIAVVAGGPSASAGLRPSERSVRIENTQVQVGGDVIIAIDGEPILDMDDLIAYLSRSTRVGQTIIMDVLRQGKVEKISVTLGARPSAN